jgi:hypothetical protein
LNVDDSLGRAGAKGEVGVVCPNDQRYFVAASAMVRPNVNDVETLE